MLSTNSMPMNVFIFLQAVGESKIAPCTVFGATMSPYIFHNTIKESQHLLTTAWHKTAYTSGECCLLLQPLFIGEAFTVK